MLFIFSHQAARDRPFFFHEENQSEISRFLGTRFFAYILMVSTPYVGLVWVPLDVVGTSPQPSVLRLVRHAGFEESCNL